MADPEDAAAAILRANGAITPVPGGVGPVTIACPFEIAVSDRATRLAPPDGNVNGNA